MKHPTLRVVVDGSNLATEGRTIPSLVQLDDAVRAFLEEYPHADVIVVVDASFEHRVAASERARFKEAEIAGEIVTPPAGAVGRGDAFILKIAQRINAMVLSNDSFQEFHEQYPWLFDVGRLLGGKPVKGVGWVFTERLPVRGVKSARVTRAAKKLAVTLPEGVVPAIGDTLTPVKAPRATKRAAAKDTTAEVVPTARTSRRAKAATAADDTTTTAAKASKEATEALTKVTKATKVTRVATPPKKAPAKKTPAKKVRVEATEATPSAGSATHSPASPVPAVALRRGRQPVNPEEAFRAFVKQYKVNGAVRGEVVAFTSHGAVIKVTVKNGASIECYAPTTSLGSPAPARARDVFKRGDVTDFRLVTVDPERRIAELALV